MRTKVPYTEFSITQGSQGYGLEVVHRGCPIGTYFLDNDVPLEKIFKAVEEHVCPRSKNEN